MLTKPRWLLHLQGASMLVLTVVLYRASHFSWGLCGLLFLALDLFMLGYLINAMWQLPTILFTPMLDQWWFYCFPSRCPDRGSRRSD